ncbi:hypothetical protein GCM10023208_24620 [Erythrobacter westpacificensis]|uniref:Uncharacterized protein n=1 Tax=Erythrobacter westpacificensis TaxID=1055231 RepID=A0ABP9KGH4_9SPHN
MQLILYATWIAAPSTNLGAMLPSNQEIPRLADEYDAAQERGEIGRQGKPVTVPDENGIVPATAADAGLTRKQIHEARQLRDAEEGGA